jgi:hypothetical protein
MGRPVSHLRYLLRRLRQRVPEIPILVGFCRSDDPVSCDAQTQAAVAADHYAGSLREAIEICTRKAAEYGETIAAPSDEPDPSSATPASSRTTEVDSTRSSSSERKQSLTRKLSASQRG